MATPTPTTKRTVRVKHLDVVRNGNDNYTATELELEGDGKSFKTIATKVICDKKSRNVTMDYVAEWWRNRVGRNFLGDFD
jgi:hypothetical protein